MKILIKIKEFIKKQSKFRLSATAGLVLVILYFVFSGGSALVADMTVDKGSIEQVVLATGRTKPREDVELGFERSGKVRSALVRVGSRVSAGQTLVVLDQSEILASLKRAKASYAEALIALDETKRTSSSQNSAALDKSVIALNDAYTKANDSIRNTTDRFFHNPDTYNPSFDLSYTLSGANYSFYIDYDTAVRLNNSRRELNATLTSWKNSIDSLKSGDKDLAADFALAEKNIIQVKSFLTDLAAALNSIRGYDQSYETVMSGFKSSVSTARADVSLAQSDLLAAREKYGNAPQTSSINGMGMEAYDDVLSKQARVDAASADVDSYAAQLEKTVIYSPISGIVTKQDAKQGEIVTSGTKLVSVISDKNLEIEANVSEVNIGKINVGDEVDVTFDALPGEVVKARVVYIDPAEVMVDGVVNYKVKVEFEGEEKSEIKTGLTANLKIYTDKRVDAIRVPIYAIEKKGGESYVKVRDGKNVLTRKIEIGITGADGMVEVLGGIKEGEILVVKSAE
jgi:RND family efflux transporter MFP subunit